MPAVGIVALDDEGQQTIRGAAPPSRESEFQVKRLPSCKADADFTPPREEQVESVTTASTGSYRGVWKSPPQSFQTPRSAFSARCSACLNGCTFSNGLCW